MIFKKVIDSLRVIVGMLSMTPIDAYQIPDQPRKRDVTPIDDDKSRTTHNPVFDGKQYERNVEQKETGGITVDWSEVDTKTGFSKMGKSNKLTPWDRGFLAEQFPTGWNTTLADVLKGHWFDGLSAAAVEMKHRDKVTGQLEFGYSERNVKKYFWAFNRAWEKEIEKPQTASAE